MIPTLVNWGIAIGGGLGLHHNPISEFIGFAPFVVLVLFVAPYKLWRRDSDKLRELTTPRLRLELVKNPEVNPQEIWWHLVVYNESLDPIDKCYAKLNSFLPNISNQPYDTMYLPWSSYAGGTETKNITIPGKSCVYLDVVMTNHKELYILTLGATPGIRVKRFPEPPGIYFIEIQVGSEKHTFEPSKIRLTLELDDSGKLQVKETSQDERQRPQAENPTNKENTTAVRRI